MLMLYHHLSGFPERINEDYINLIPSINGYNVSFLFAGFGKLCVAIFIFLSGYGIYLSMNNHKQEEVIKKRICSLYKIFWKVFIIFVPICLIYGKIKFNLLEIILNFIGLNITIKKEWWFLTPIYNINFYFTFNYENNG